MSYQTILPRALAARGLQVETVPGWESRGGSGFNPGGAVCHWTAGPARSTTRPSLNICVKGRIDLPGPLCNIYLTRDGIAVVVAAGTANHAGAGSWRGLVGNSKVFGTECEAAGSADFTDAQRWSYPRVNAAFGDIGGFGAEMVCGHSEWAGARKTDINGYTMDEMRSAVAAIRSGNPAGAVLPPATSEEDDMKHLILIGIKSEDPTLGGYWVLNIADHTRYRIGAQEQLVMLRAQGITEHRDQGAVMLDRFRLIDGL